LGRKPWRRSFSFTALGTAPGAGAGLQGLLARNGHEVFTPTLTPDINLDTHILDVVNEMRWQELNHVVLVGHSYGGMVISGVAEKMEKSISSFVMVDAFLPETGQAPVDLQPPSVQDSLR
jgi:pimeloyl-ACP methyl ester carboxylesterase